MDKSKRGRRPKKQINGVVDTVITDTPIIAHLPIELSDVCDQTSDIFIKAENTEDTSYLMQEHEIKNLRKKVDELTLKLNKYEKNNKPSIIPCEGNSKCWWDKKPFNTPVLEMPESYFNGIFTTTGKFCSWECMMAYNIDMNDMNVSKRKSLINQMYMKTYGTFKEIKQAPSWKILDDYGGPIDINEFRNSLTFADIEYNYIKPPIISRISYVEKIPIKKEIEITKPDEIVLKRSKPLKTSKYDLENIMGFKKIANTN